MPAGHVYHQPGFGRADCRGAQIVQGLKKAWSILSCIPVGGAAAVTTRRQVAVALPVAGALLGLCLWILGVFLQQVGSPAAAGMVAGLFVPVLYLLLTAGRNLQGIIQVMEVQISARSLPRHAVYWSVLVFLAVIATRAVFCAGLVFAGAAWWLLVPPALAATFYADSLLLPAGHPGEDDPWALPVPRHWALAALISLVAGARGGNLAAAVFALVATWLFSMAAPALAKRLPAANQDMQTRAFMELLELAVLLIGLLMLLD